MKKLLSLLVILSLCTSAIAYEINVPGYGRLPADITYQNDQFISVVIHFPDGTERSAVGNYLSGGGIHWEWVRIDSKYLPE